VAATLALGRVVSWLLYGIKPTDPPTLVMAALVLAGVALVATYVPVRRAARLDPDSDAAIWIDHCQSPSSQVFDACLGRIGKHWATFGE
jgi:hypothetical protein